MGDLAVAWVVIPAAAVSAAASLWSAVWTHLSTKNLKHVESRLHRDEEAFRLAHSPRVVAAIELWSAFCEFEVAIEKALYPNMFNLYEAPTTREQDELMKDDAHVQRALEQLRFALKELMPALNKAELLLDETTFAACSELFKVYDSAYGEHAFAREFGGARSRVQQFREIERVNQTTRCRAGALAALKTMIGMETK